MGFDLKSYSVDPENQKAVLELMHPQSYSPLTDDDGNVASITLHGPDSNEQKKARRKWMDKALNNGAKRKKMNISSEQIEAQAIDILVAATADWSNIGYEGEDLDCTPENVRKIYTEVPFIREQVDEFINDRSNFLGK